MRRAKWVAFFFLLGLLVVTAPDHSSAQPGGGKGGKGGKGGFGGFGGGDANTQPGGGGGGFGGKGGGGGNPFGGGGGGGNPFGGGNVQPGGGGNPFGGGGGGNPFGGGGGGGNPFGGGGGGGPGGGRGGFQMDPEQNWNRLANGSDTVDLSKIDPRIRDFSRKQAEKYGTDVLPESGIMTKAQYIDLANRNTAKISAFNQSGGQGGPGGQITIGPNGQGGMNFNLGGGGPGRGGPGGGNPDEKAASRMRDQDKNGDGKISREEADRMLQPNFDRIDADGDGYITMDEYRAYYANQQGGRSNGGPGGNGGDWSNWNQQDPRRSAEEERPVAMRYGHLPKELPNLYPWFDEYDADKDGQVALHEWRKAGKDIAEFQKMDLNSDGLITADELLRFGRKVEEDAKIAAINAGEAVPRPSFAGGRPGSGGFSLPGAAIPSSDTRGGQPNNYGSGGERPMGKGGGDGGGDRPPGKGGDRPPGKGGGKGDNTDTGGSGGGNPFREPGSGGGSGDRPTPKGKGKG